MSKMVQVLKPVFDLDKAIAFFMWIAVKRIRFSSAITIPFRNGSVSYLVSSEEQMVTLADLKRTAIDRAESKRSAESFFKNEFLQSILRQFLDGFARICFHQWFQHVVIDFSCSSRFQPIKISVAVFKLFELSLTQTDNQDFDVSFINIFCNFVEL